MNVVHISAPGKLFLLGEYAVLESAPALLTAVDRRATVTAEDSTVWKLTAPEIGIDSLELGAGGTLPNGLDEATRTRLALFEAVREEVERLPDATTGPLQLTIDTSALYRDGHKLGLGSSAAVSVALTAALANAHGIGLTRRALFAFAVAAHRSIQGESGSGGDIATSVYGGLIHYRREHPPAPATWPAGLDLFAVETGTGSSTVDLVARVTAYRERDPERYGRDLDALSALATDAEQALADADTFLSLADEYFRALETLDAHSGAGIVTDRHLHLREIAAASGAVFKPTGAGGGDLGLVFAKLGVTDQLRSAFTEVGAAVIPVPYSPDGVRIDTA